MIVTKLDSCIGQLGYILGDCNECSKRKTCEYIPKAGELVRYNCPFYEKKKRR